MALLPAKRAAEAVASLKTLLSVRDTEKSGSNQFVASFIEKVMALHCMIRPPDPHRFREFLANISTINTFQDLCYETSRYVAYYRLNAEQVAFAADELENRFQVSDEILDVLKQTQQSDLIVARLNPPMLISYGIAAS
jgi:hypothetical protein